MILSVASGKGGTGKTLVATSLALSLKDSYEVMLLDCDVEEPNDHVFLKPIITGWEPVNIPIPGVSEDKCTYCGKCAEVCGYRAIAVLGSQVLTFPQLCHGCGACSYLCPEKAITEEPRETGVIEWGHSDKVSFVQGILNIGEAMAPPVIRKVKERGNNSDVVIRDTPPGSSCPVVEAIKGSDFCFIVTEPTPFGLNDLGLTVDMMRELAIPCGVIINRAGIGDAGVEEYCRKEGICILLTVPLDTEIARLYSQGITLAAGIPRWKKDFLTLFIKASQILDERACRSKR